MPPISSMRIIIDVPDRGNPETIVRKVSAAVMVLILFSNVTNENGGVELKTVIRRQAKVRPKLSLRKFGLCTKFGYVECCAIKQDVRLYLAAWRSADHPSHLFLQLWELSKKNQQHPAAGCELKIPLGFGPKLSHLLNRDRKSLLAA